MKSKLTKILCMLISIKKSNIFSIFILSIGMLSTAQVRMTNAGSTISSVNSSAFIDASSNNTNNITTGIGKGLVFPRVDLSTFNFVGTAGIASNFPTRFDGMIIYNTNVGGVAGAGATEGTLSEGFWYYHNKSTSVNGGTWKKIQGGGNFDIPIFSYSSNVTLNETHGTVIVNTSAGDVFITLPVASAATNRIYSIIKSDSSDNKLVFSETILGNDFSFSQANIPCKYQIQSNGSSWILIQ